MSNDIMGDLKVTKKLMTMPSMNERLQNYIPDESVRKAFIDCIVNACSANPALYNCSQTSFFTAVYQAAAIGLMPNTPEHYASIIPYGSEAKYQLEYRGLIKLAYDGTAVKFIYAETVYENDQFEQSLGAHPDLIHKPTPLGKDQGKCIGSYAICWLKDSEYPLTRVLTMKDIIRHRSASPGYNRKPESSPWTKSFDAMARKSAVVEISAFIPKAPKLLQAVMLDNEIEGRIEKEQLSASAIFKQSAPKPAADKADYTVIPPDEPPAAPVMPVATPQNGNATITDEEIQDLLELLQESEIPLKDWNGYLVREFGIENIESILKDDLQAFRNWILSAALKIKQAKETAAVKPDEPTPKDKVLAAIEEFKNQMTPEQLASFNSTLKSKLGDKSLQEVTFSDLKVLRSIASGLVNEKKAENKLV